MKHFIVLFVSLLLLVSCNDAVVEKPDNLIDKDKMVDIIYDLSLLQAIRADNPEWLQKATPAQYVYKKYKIDSLQFAKSDRYYASYMDTYKKMYESVQEKLDNYKKTTDSLAKLRPKPKPDVKLLSDTLRKRKPRNSP